MCPSGHPAGLVPGRPGQVGGGRPAASRLRGPPEAVRAMVALHLARGQTALAAARLHRRLNEIGQDNLVTVPLLAQLVEVQLAQPDLGGAAETAEALAARSGHVRAQAEAELALGSVRAATGDASVREHLDRSLGLFVRLRMPHAVGRVHLALARTLAEVLLGDREPGGRLPTVWPASRRPARLCGVHPRGQLRLRPRRVEPAFCFGHGLGDSSWDYLEVTAPPPGPRPRRRGDRPGPQHRPRPGRSRPGRVPAASAVERPTAGWSGSPAPAPTRARRSPSR